MIALEEGHNISLAFRGSVQHLVGRDILPEAYADSGQSTRASKRTRGNERASGASRCGEPLKL